MLIRRKPDLSASHTTPQSVYERRREILKMFGLALPGILVGCGRGTDASAEAPAAPPNIPSSLPELTIAKRGAFSTTEPQTSYQDATHYNNFYEFGTSKADPARNSGKFRPAPWTVEIAGNAEVTGKFTLEDILKPHALAVTAIDGAVLHGVLDRAGVDHDGFAACQTGRQERPGPGG